MLNLVPHCICRAAGPAPVISPYKNMIIRIFRIEIDPATRSAFEAGFQSLSVDAVTQSAGNLSCEIGMPTRWSPNTYTMISRWRDEDALVAFAGPEWSAAVIPVGMERFGKNYSVEHYVINNAPAAGNGAIFIL
jgi:quinol monooxygenase YgiN